MRNSRKKNKSNDNKHSDHHIHHYERKCVTPSLNSQHQKKSNY